MIGMHMNLGRRNCRVLRRGWRLCPVMCLGQHVQPVRRVVVVCIIGICGRLHFSLQARPIAHFLGRRGDGRRRWLLDLDGLALGLNTQSSAVEVKRTRGLHAGSKASKESRVGTWGREHRPAAPGSETGPQRRLVGGWEAASDVMSITEVIICRPRQHGRTERARPEGTWPAEGSSTRAGKE